MKKVLFLALIILLTSRGISQDNGFVQVIGNVKGSTKGCDYIYYYRGGSDIDSAKIDNNGKFAFKLPVHKPFVQLMFTQYEKVIRGGFRPYPLLIDKPGEIIIDMDIEKGFYDATLSGMKTPALFVSFLKKQLEISTKVSEEITKINGKPWIPQPQRPLRTDSLSMKLKSLSDSLSKLYTSNLIFDFVSQNNDSYVGIYILNSTGISSLNVEELERAFKLLSLDIQKTAEGEKLAAHIRGIKGSSIGSKVKCFELKDQNGNPVSFEQFKGKYVWIDFWASWCGPCKQSFPHMREIYKKYSNKNFEILGISTDDKIDPWLKILPTLNNPWPQVWDNKNIMSEFAVTALPTSFLIAPDGTILIKEVGFNSKTKGDIEKRLDELFGDINNQK